MRLGFLVLMGLVGAAPAFADEAVRTGAAAFGDWRTDAPGVRRLITPADLPAPYATRSTANMSQHEARTEAERSKGAAGLHGRSFRQRAQHAPRHSYRAERRHFRCGNRSGAGARLSPGRGRRSAGARRDLRRRLAAAIRDRLLPVRSGSEVCLCRDAGLRCALSLSQRRDESRRPCREDREPAERRRTLDTRPRFFARRQDAVRLGRLRQQCRRGRAAARPGQHRGSAGRRLVRRREATAPTCSPSIPTARHERVYATGIRNCSGLAVQPGTGALWCAVNERDGLGDDLPPDYVTHVAEGAFYGWPWYYLGDHQDPRHKGERPDLANSITTPDVLIQAHSAPLGIAFYTADQFPSEYRGRRVRHACTDRGIARSAPATKSCAS